MYFLAIKLLLAATICITTQGTYSQMILCAYPVWRNEDTLEAFINNIIPVVIGSSLSKYYIIKGADICRFEKFDYDEWIKYHLQETVPLSILNELAYKVHVAHQPYYWHQDRLQKAVCITEYQADSLLYQWDSLRHYIAHTRKERKRHEQSLRQWEQVPMEEKRIYSFSQPQFTDDGQYAVIDVNWKVNAVLGEGFTLLFRHTSDGWRCVGNKRNWGVDR